MTYNNLRRMIAYHQSHSKGLCKDWTPEKGCRWFVSLQITEDLWELTNADRAEYAFDGDWPVCTCKKHVEEWLWECCSLNDITDLEISEWVSHHFGKA